MRARPLFMMVAIFAFGATNTAFADTQSAPASNNLVTVKGAFDTLNVLPAAFADGKPLKIAIVPIKIEYSKRRRDPEPYYRDSDYQLKERDIDLLQKSIGDRFTASWFQKRHWRLVSDPAVADIRLTVVLKDFWLAAPLDESIYVHKTFTEESARFTLTGLIERAGDQQHLVEFSDKRKVRTLSTPPGRLERFTPLTFWRDMRRELDIAATQLDRLIPAS